MARPAPRRLLRLERLEDRTLLDAIGVLPADMALGDDLPTEPVPSGASAVFSQPFSDSTAENELGAASATTKGRLLVIAGGDFADMLSDFVAHKVSLGWSVDVADTAAVGATTAEIRDYVRGRYGDPATRPDALLLVGDTNHIPHFRGVGAGYPDTDLYYACMDDGDDWRPEFPVGRFSVTNGSELQSVIDKTIHYETAPSGAWTRRAAFLAGDEYSDLTEGTHDWVIDNYLDPLGYTSDKLYQHTHGATTNDVREAFNEGRMLGVYAGHGTVDSWVDGPPFAQSDVGSLSNTGKYAFVASFACTTGDYSVDECFMETWLRRPDKAAVGCWGASVFSFWWYDSILEKKLFEAIYDDNCVTFGTATVHAKELFLEHCGATGTTRRYFELYNLLGDPTVEFPDLPELLQIDGGEGDDVIRLARNGGDPTLIDVFLNSESPVETAELASLRQINVHALGGDDALIVDSSHGLITLPLGIHYDGGDGVTTLTLTNPGDTTTTYTPGATLDSGSLQVGDLLRIDFVNVNGEVAVNDLGGTLVYEGTAGDDQFEVAAAGNITLVEALGSRPAVRGGGQASLIINGREGHDEFVVAPGPYPNVTVEGGPGDDSALLHDSDGLDTFQARPGSAALSGPGFTHTVNDSRYIRAYAWDDDGFSDVALLYDSDADDVFYAGPSSPEGTVLRGTTLAGQSFANSVSGFTYVHAYSRTGGSDVAYLHDNPATGDWLKAWPQGAVFSGGGFYDRVLDFEEVHTTATPDNEDVAQLYDSDADDVFYAGPSSPEGTVFRGTTLAGQSFANSVSGFPYVHAYSRTGGSDVAYLHDNPATGDFFRAWPQFAIFLGGGFYDRVLGFEEVRATATAGEQDVACLYDSDADDVFYGGPSSPEGTVFRGTALSGQSFANSVSGFPYVHAYSRNEGTDGAYLYDSSRNDRFDAWSHMARMYGAGFYWRALEFEQGEVIASERDDYDQAWEREPTVWKAVGDWEAGNMPPVPLTIGSSQSSRLEQAWAAWATIDETDEYGSTERKRDSQGITPAAIDWLIAGPID